MRLPVSLGVSAEERREPQAVEFDVRVDFAADPVACESDLIQDAWCYGEACEAIRRVAGGREFRLIESLAREVHAALRARSGAEGAGIEVAVHKLQPPVPGLRGGAVFRYGDLR